VEERVTPTVTGDDVRAAVAAFVATLQPAVSRTDDWARPAGTLEWSCAKTLAHVADCVLWYALNLAGRTAEPDAWDWTDTPSEPIAAVLSIIQPSAELLAVTVDAAPASARGWHPYGIADPSGFAGMGCDEILVHGHDIATGLGLTFDPPPEVGEHVVRRMFPWSPTGADPWTTLLWANGRTDLPGVKRPGRRWLWHCRPLIDWDGTIPT
jgi:uncharacterized protein (TIGR03083 family)